MSKRKSWPLAALAVAAVLSAPPWSAAAEDVPATIDADTTWSATGSPYRVVEDATVAAGVTLTLEPGVAVELDEGISLSVAGTLVARGTSAEPITFGGVAGVR